MRDNFWVGCITGFICALLFFSVAMFVHVQHLKWLEVQMTNMLAVQQEQEKWIEDNRMVMQTYKFFNESWQAILDMENRK